METLEKSEKGGQIALCGLDFGLYIIQNNPTAGSYWYPVIDGFPLPNGGIHIVPVPKKTRTIVLASDGYPILKDNLAASEQALQYILANDPMLFRLYKATKGMQEGSVSYDDRAYIRLRIIDKPTKQHAVIFKDNSMSELLKKKRKKKKIENEY